ncbi:hypothetical protein [Clostridium cellulovorans]|uniref:HNH endonuclease n=1 Tax=Clostridium cellulovorans (strain ATCC 35296 / DSM 3052 / OCM 3 / 743B) TaxID=573061 RepID=D9SX17_CLOC7|nr:hypothetical protein [Clostridium cellulovorans]ADL51378.1 hypothetical protein Clocel_1632 [Clostridium cellulovorans 743B]
MKCYYQGCNDEGITKEHIPPRSFFPDGEKEQLLTVKSCEKHNNAKSQNDLYVLIHICMNASPSNRAREVFLNKVKPQLDFNNNALRKKLLEHAVSMENGTVKYKVDISRFDEFFTALSCGIIYKSCDCSLPLHYSISHIYPNFESNDDFKVKQIEKFIDQFYSGKPMNFINFGKPNTKNESIYTVKVFGIPEFKSSITIVHEFYGTFKVISMLTTTLDRKEL